MDDNWMIVGYKSMLIFNEYLESSVFEDVFIVFNDSLYVTIRSEYRYK